LLNPTRQWMKGIICTGKGGPEVLKVSDEELVPILEKN